jgi:hypothetical protein
MAPQRFRSPDVLSGLLNQEGKRGTQDVAHAPARGWTLRMLLTHAVRRTTPGGLLVASRGRL